MPIPVSERCRRARSGAPSRRERQSRTLRSISPNCRCAGAPISTSELGTWQVVSIATAAVVVVLPDWRERQSRALRGRSRNNSCCQKSRSMPQSRANSSGSKDPRHVTSHQHGAAGGSGTQGGMASVASMTKGALAARGVISLAARSPTGARPRRRPALPRGMAVGRLRHGSLCAGGRWSRQARQRSRLPRNSTAATLRLNRTPLSLAKTIRAI